MALSSSLRWCTPQAFLVACRCAYDAITAAGVADDEAAAARVPETTNSGLNVQFCHKADRRFPSNVASLTGLRPGYVWS